MDNQFEGLSLEQLAEMHYSTQEQVIDDQENLGDGQQQQNPEDPDIELNHQSQNGDPDDLPEDPNSESSSQDWNTPNGEGEGEPNNPNSLEENTNLESEVGLVEFKPLTFKANGKEWTIENQDEAIRLMQMGLGSQKAVQEFKDSRPIVKALKENDLWDSTMFNLMIAAKNGDARAYKAMAEHFGISNEQLDELNYSDDEQQFIPENKIESNNTIEFKERFKELDHQSPVRQMIMDFDTTSLNGILNDPLVFDQFVMLEQKGVLNDILAQVDKAYSMGYVNPSTPKIQTISAVIASMSQRVGYDLLDPNANAVPKQQQQEPTSQQMNTQPTQQTKPINTNTRVNSAQRRSATASPESFNSAPPASKQQKTVADLLDEAEARGDYEEKRRLLEEHYGITLE